MADNYWQGCPPKMNDARFLADYRTPTVREQFNKSINGITRDDDYRLFLQQNAERIMDTEWVYYRKTNSCSPNVCIHQNYPTRSNPANDNAEMKLHNDVRTGKTPSGQPECRKHEDYRMTVTKQFSQN